MLMEVLFYLNSVKRNIDQNSLTKIKSIHLSAQTNIQLIICQPKELKKDIKIRIKTRSLILIRFD